MKKGILLLLASILTSSTLFAQGADVLRRKYSQLSYGQNTFIHNDWKMKSDLEINYTHGRTFYLNEDEILGLIRFGIDGTWTDFTYTQYTRTLPVEGINEGYKFNQFDYALNVGLSVHINPVDDLYVHTHFRYAPAYSLLTGDKQIYGNYATYFMTGLSVSYRFIALGFEGRFGGCNYNNIASAKRIEQFMPNPENVVSQKVKYRGWRAYISLMF